MPFAEALDTRLLCHAPACGVLTLRELVVPLTDSLPFVSESASSQGAASLSLAPQELKAVAAQLVVLLAGWACRTFAPCIVDAGVVRGSLCP